MKKRTCLFTLTLIGYVISCGNLFAQTDIGTEGQQLTRSSSTQKSTESTQEEMVVRAAYDKLTKLNRAAQSSRRREGAPVDENSILKFELFNFSVGPIKQITLTRAEELVSTPTGEIILLIRTETTENENKPTVSYKAEWTAGQYAAIFEPQWTISDLMSFESHKDFDVGEYASYMVTVTYKGKTKTYKALALFHNAYKFQGVLKPTFWDSTVGLGGTLTDVWNENLPTTEPQNEPEPTNSSLEILTSPTASSDDSFASYVAYDDGGGEYSTLATTAGPIVRRTVEDQREHISGAHGETVGMQGVCFDEANNQQRCQVNITDSFTYENGEISNLFFYHANKVLDKVQTATGSKSTQISCFSARGIGTGNCSLFGCGFTISWSGSGSNIHLVGGDVWNGEVILNHTCSSGSVAGGTCTTPSFDGSCPIGSTPNGTGLCCFSSTSSCGSLTAINKCYMYGGDYDFFSCTCSGCDICGGSPVLIDVKGDGIALTGPNDGVDFDLNGNGTKDRLGWTVANSDDAWLALDRNENGNIDNGAELFGNFTPQPAGTDKNGFLALAEFDKPANGGNGDGVINGQDTVFERLRLWQDSNHNGRVDDGELHTLASQSIKELEFDFKESRRTDDSGNEFRYRAKVKDTQEGKVARWAWDVFLSHN